MVLWALLEMCCNRIPICSAMTGVKGKIFEAIQRSENGWISYATFWREHVHINCMSSPPFH